MIAKGGIGMCMEIVHEHLCFDVGVFSRGGLNCAKFIKGWFYTGVNFGVEIKGTCDGLYSLCAFEVEGWRV